MRRSCRSKLTNQDRSSFIGRPLPCSEKYILEFDAAAGQVSLTIRQIGPGDEGQYGCTVKNPYGETTATLNVNPDTSYKKGTRTMKMSDTRLGLQRCQT